MSDSSHEQQAPQNNGLQIKQDDKFFSRLMSKETSMANSSCRVYYGGASGAVPFMWESQPGTPKHSSCDISLPPLTPPPSYHSSFKSKSLQKKRVKVKPTLLTAIFPRLIGNPRKNRASPSSFRSSTSSSSSLSSWSSLHGSSSSSSSSCTSANSLNRKFLGRSYFSCSRSPVHNCMEGDGEEEEEGLQGSPTSTLCFGVKRRNLNGFRGCRSMANMKKALISIVSHGSGH